MATDSGELERAGETEPPSAREERRLIREAQRGSGAALAALFVVPLGLALGGFLPLGLRALARLTPHRREAVAWAWAAGCLAAAVGSALATVFSMSIGFRAVLLGGLASYVLAAAVLRALPTREVP